MRELSEIARRMGAATLARPSAVRRPSRRLCRASSYASRIQKYLSRNKIIPAITKPRVPVASRLDVTKCSLRAGLLHLELALHGPVSGPPTNHGAVLPAHRNMLPMTSLWHRVGPFCTGGLAWARPVRIRPSSDRPCSKRRPGRLLLAIIAPRRHAVPPGVAHFPPRPYPTNARLGTALAPPNLGATAPNLRGAGWARRSSPRGAPGRLPHAEIPLILQSSH